MQPTRLWEPHFRRFCTSRDEENGDLQTSRGSQDHCQCNQQKQKRSCLIIADVGTAATSRNLGVHHKRISKWVLPNNMLALHSAHTSAAVHFCWLPTHLYEQQNFIGVMEVFIRRNSVTPRAVAGQLQYNNLTAITDISMTNHKPFQS